MLSLYVLRIRTTAAAAWLSRAFASLFGQAKPPSEHILVYLNGLSTTSYMTGLRKLRAVTIESFGMHPLPMLFHSLEYPFSLLHKPLEWTRLFRGMRCRTLDLPQRSPSAMNSDKLPL